MDDVRIATGLRHHRKTKRLRRLLGAEGCWSLVCLFLWAGEERWTGDLSGLTDEDIEEEAGWEGAPGALVSALLEVRFLVGEPGRRAIHGWEEHNPYAASKGERIEKGRRGANARWKKRAESKAADATGMPPACSEHAPGMPPACPPHATRTIEQCPPAPAPTYSVANATGAVAPPDPLFGTGLAFLTARGVPEKPARAFLGKLRKQVGDVAAAALLAEAEAQDISDPIPWLSRAAMNARAGPAGQPASRAMGAIQQLEEMKRGLAGNRNHDGFSEVDLPRLGAATGR